MNHAIALPFKWFYVTGEIMAQTATVNELYYTCELPSFHKRYFTAQSLWPFHMQGLGPLVFVHWLDLLAVFTVEVIDVEHIVQVKSETIIPIGFMPYIGNKVRYMFIYW